MNRGTMFGKALVFSVAALAGALSAVHAQEGARTVADGVYTDIQAARGASVYDTACAGCHRADLGGATGPALREQRFAQEFAGKDLKALFTRIATTMPRNSFSRRMTGIPAATSSAAPPPWMSTPIFPPTSW